MYVRASTVRAGIPRGVQLYVRVRTHTMPADVRYYIPRGERESRLLAEKRRSYGGFEDGRSTFCCWYSGGVMRGNAINRLFQSAHTHTPSRQFAPLEYL